MQQNQTFINYEQSDRVLITNNMKNKNKILPILTNESGVDYVKQESNINNELKYFQCYICENSYVYDFISLQIKCDHLFCHRCGKLFYEEKIEQGEFENFKCGITYCKFIIPDFIIETLISKTHLEIITKKKENCFSLLLTKQNSSLNSENLVLNRIVDFNSNLKTFFEKNKFQNVINYSLKNVCDIGSNENFFQYSKNKNQICPFCKEMQLYGKNTRAFVKCLNCLKKFCKYCFKQFDKNHLENDNKNRCRVYYRRKIDKNKNQISFSFKYIQIMLMLFGGYLVIATFFIVKMKKTFVDNKFSLYVFLKILYYFLLSIIFTPLSILIIPYLSILTCI